MNERELLLEALDYLNSGVKELERLGAERRNLMAQADQLVQQIRIEEANAQRAGSYSALASQYGSKVVSGGTGILSAAGTIVGVIAGLIIYGFFGLVASIINVGSFGPMIAGMGLVLGIIVAAVIIIISRKGSSAARNASNRLLNNMVDANNRTVSSAPGKIGTYRAQYDHLVYNLIPENEAKNIVIYESYQDVIEAFAPNYLYSACIDKVIYYVRNMRADTLKEALNMYEEEEFRNKVIDNQERQTYYASVTAGAALETARNTGRIADNTEKMVVSLQNIDANTANIAANTAAIADNTFRAAQCAAITARNTGRSAQYLDSINASINHGF